MAYTLARMQQCAGLVPFECGTRRNLWLSSHKFTLLLPACVPGLVPGSIAVSGAASALIDSPGLMKPFQNGGPFCPISSPPKLKEVGRRERQSKERSSNYRPIPLFRPAIGTQILGMRRFSSRLLCLERKHPSG